MTQFGSTKICDECNGNGWTYDFYNYDEKSGREKQKTCSKCKGSGQVETKE
jgi:DnaJ-class molecular chaperone